MKFYEDLEKCHRCGVEGQLAHEKWRDINGYEGLYQVSNLGRVRGLPRDVPHTTAGFTQHLRGGVMKGMDNGRGYLVVSLNRDGKRKNHYIHRLVASAFCENPEGKPHVNHLDHNRSNNAASNLEWCTAKENINYSAHLGRHPRENAKPTNTGVKYIRRRSRKTGDVYCVYYRKKKVHGSFNTLEEAIVFLEGVLR